MWVALNKKNVVMAVSEKPFSMTNCTIKEILNPAGKWSNLIGGKLNSQKSKDIKDLKVAIICNWGENCGISTYSQYLTEAIIPKVKETKVFAEILKEKKTDPVFVSRCWKRGESLKPLINNLLAWIPDFIIIQHEFGIFPKATYFLQLLQGIEEIPYVVTMHSVYEHLDKSICTSAVKNLVLHSYQGRDILRKLGNTNNIFIVPHGCVSYPEEDRTELWNIFQNPYTIVQFGFGFFYKGVDKMLDAIHYLKESDKKFENIFYCYLCSENVHTNIIHSQYHEFLLNKVETLDLHDNVVIIKKYQTGQIINNYLRTAKIAVFPYVSDPKNVVYGASGAIRIAMACGTPVIASNCHQFDDLEDVVCRPGTHLELAAEIDQIFSNDKYRKSLINKSNEYIKNNNWDISADRYLDLFYNI